jgi:hypothetical protein
MDDIELVVSALALGATAGLKETASSAVKDAYGALKKAFGSRYTAIALGPLEDRPESQSKRDSLAEDIHFSAIPIDESLINAAEELLDQVERTDPSAPTIVGIDISDLRAAFLRIKNVRSDGTGVRVTRSSFGDGVDIEDVQAGKDGAARLPS